MDTQIGTGGLTVTLGTRRYAVIHPWHRVRLGHISQHAVDSKGRVYVFQRTGSPVQVLSPEGEALASWGGGEIADPHGIFITPDDRIFVTDRDAHQVLVFDTDGKRQAAYGERHHAHFAAPFNHPTDVAVAANGDFYVSDGYGNAHVHWFGADGTHRKTWGGIGTGAGQFSTPHGVWVTPDNKVLVGDRENNRIQVFSADGTYLTEWGDLYHPMDLWGDADGTIYVTDQAPRIVAFSPTGDVLGRCKAVATWSHGLWGDRAGNLYCSEHNGQLTKLARLS